jgi:copper resistance protein B
MSARAVAAMAATVVIALAAMPAPARGQEAAAERPREAARGGHESTSGNQATSPTHDHPAQGEERPVASSRPAVVPPIADADRAAAFPQVDAHTVHDQTLHGFVLFDQLEWHASGSGIWDTRGWLGGDLNRLWFRTEGGADRGGVDEADVHLLFGRAIARWWDLLVGVRQDMRPGPVQTWAAIGVQGLAPYWFEIEATAHVGESGRTLFRLEAEYELLLTNRFILQPLVELDVYGKADPERGIGAGPSTAGAGLRLRYEIRRELAPYVGLIWTRKLLGTADAAEAAGEETRTAHLAAGFRVWF